MAQPFALYGLHAARAAWANPARAVRALYVADGRGWDAPSGLARPRPEVVPRHRLDRLAGPGAVHQGAVLLADPLPEADASDFAALPRGLVVVLDQVTDPRNVGAILRSACAFGASGLLLQRRHAPPLSGALAKAASGAVEHLPVATAVNLTRALEQLKDAGFTAIGLDERGGDIRALPPADKIALVLGAEGPGIRRLVREACCHLARLPTAGPVPTLNVSAAAAAALFALCPRVG
jgi:23S rRNA (guanosine2251-2'-O)-methyltransferase